MSPTSEGGKEYKLYSIYIYIYIYIYIAPGGAPGRATFILGPASSGMLKFLKPARSACAVVKKNALFDHKCIV